MQKANKGTLGLWEQLIKSSDEKDPLDSLYKKIFLMHFLIKGGLE